MKKKQKGSSVPLENRYGYFSYHRPVKPYRRKIHIDKKEYSYRIVDVYIQIRSPDGSVTCNTDSYCLNDTTYNEWHFYDYEEDNYGFYADRDCPIAYPQITPQLIKDFVQKHKDKFDDHN